MLYQRIKKAINRGNVFSYLVQGAVFWVLFFCVNISLFPKLFKQVNMILIFGCTAISAVWIVADILHRKVRLSTAVKINPFFLSLVLYEVYAAAQLLCFSTNENYSFASILFLYLFCPASLLCFYALAERKTKLFSDRLLLLYVIICCIISVLAICEFFTGEYILSFRDTEIAMRSVRKENQFHFLRASVFSASYLHLGDYLCIGVVVSLYQIIVKKRYLMIIPAALSGVGILVTLTRASYVICGFVALATIMMLIRMNGTPDKKAVIIGIAAAFLAIVATWCLLDENMKLLLIRRFQSIFDWSPNSSGNGGRVRRWKFFEGIWTESSKNLLLGIGISNAAYGNAFGNVTESGLLENLVELGLFGSLFYYGVLLYPSFLFLKEKKTEQGILIFCCLLIFLLHDLIYQIGISVDGRIITWLLNGLLLCEVQTKREEKPGLLYGQRAD